MAKIKNTSKCPKCGREIFSGDKLCIKCYRRKRNFISFIYVVFWFFLAIITDKLFETPYTFGYAFTFVLLPFIIRKKKYINERIIYNSKPYTLDELNATLQNDDEFINKCKDYLKVDSVDNLQVAKCVDSFYFYNKKKLKSNIINDYPTLILPNENQIKKGNKIISAKSELTSTCEKCGCEIFFGDVLCTDCYRKDRNFTYTLAVIFWIFLAAIAVIFVDFSYVFICLSFLFLAPYFMKRNREHYLTDRVIYNSKPYTFKELSAELQNDDKFLNKCSNHLKTDNIDKIDFEKYVSTLYFDKEKILTSNIIKDFEKTMPRALPTDKIKKEVLKESSATVKKDSSDELLNRYLQLCGEQKGNTSVVFNLSYLLIFSQMEIPLQLFDNKYVNADTVYLLYTYTIKHFEKQLSGEKERFLDYISKGIMLFFDYSFAELSSLQSNRIPYYSQLPEKVYSDIDILSKIAKLIYDYDTSYKSFVKFSKDSPLILIDEIDTSIHNKTEATIKSYFKSITSLMEKKLKNI